jgi:hydroxymethylpyrimidine/phosphomethylpyrimidine kinase
MGTAPLILVVAGHDSSGGAGLDADRAAIELAGCSILPVATAFTDQDAREFRSLGSRRVEDWWNEAQAALEKRPAAIKFGLLPGRAHLRAAAELVAHARAQLGSALPVVLDPVLRSSTGGRFVDDEGVQEYRAALLPLRLFWTPNLPEAAELMGGSLATLESDLEARWRWARAWLDEGAEGLVLKAGHGAEDPVMDLVLSRGEGLAWNSHPRVPGAKLRGSGCRYASTLAAGLVCRADPIGGLHQAAAHASRCLSEAISRSMALH